jgi:peptide/nickel transport system substrate-binding protein
MIKIAVATAALVSLAMSAQAGGVVTVAMTAGEIPITTGTPDQGFEGYRFVALNLYDGLVNWDLSHSDKASDIKPGLATGWHIDPANNKRWLFDLRQGVKWHDGCAFTAQDVVWNFERLMNDKAPQFETFQFALSRGYLTSIADVQVVNDSQVAIDTKTPDSLLPYEISYIPLISRCRAQALKYDWSAYASQPSGTGPYRFDKLVPHERLELVPNPDYWDKTRVPKQDRLVLLPMPEANTRVAALLSGQVNFHGGAPAGRDSTAEIRRHADLHQHLSACLGLSAEFRHLAVQGSAGAPGGQ